MTAKIFILSLMILFLGPFHTYAQEIDIHGENAPEFQMAVDKWLEGDDLAALESLSVLARSDNRAAQILLARIAYQNELYAHATKNMSQRERVTLLRPGRLSASTWLKNAAEVPLAKAFLDQRRQENLLEAATTFLEFGETSAFLLTTEEMLRQGLLDDASSAISLVADPTTIQGLSYLSFVVERMKSDGAQGLFLGLSGIQPDLASLKDRPFEAQEVLAWMPNLLSTFRGYTGTPRPDFDKRLAVIAENIEHIDALAPARNFCDKYCSASTNECMITIALSRIGGHHFSYSSPSERFIPNELYWSSPRIELDVVRKGFAHPSSERPDQHLCAANAFSELEVPAFGPNGRPGP